MNPLEPSLSRPRRLRWIRLTAAGAVLSLGVVVAVVVFSEKPGFDPTIDDKKAPIAGHPVSVAERERRRDLAQKGERGVIQALRPKAVGFGVKTTQLLSIKVEHDSAFAFSPDGTKLAIGKRGGEVEIRDLATNEPIRTLPTLQKRVRRLAFSPVGNTLVSLGSSAFNEPGGQGNSVCLWNFETGERKHAFWLSASFTFSLAISPDASRFLAGSSLRDMETGKEIRNFGEMARDSSFCPGGARLAIADSGETQVFDSRNGESLKRFATRGSHAPDRIAFSGDGRTFALLGSEAVLIDLESGAERTLPLTPEVINGRVQTPMLTGAFTPDGRLVLTANANSFQSVKFWDPATGKEWKSPHAVWGHVIAISPGGLLIAAASSEYGDSEIRIYAMPDAIDI